MQHVVTLNEWPASQKCSTCPLTFGLVQAVPGQYSELSTNTYVCSRGEDATTCVLPEAFSVAKTLVSTMNQQDFRSALRHRRKLAANPFCKQCGGEGQRMNLATKIYEACECTK